MRVDHLAPFSPSVRRGISSQTLAGRERGDTYQMGPRANGAHGSEWAESCKRSREGTSGAMKGRRLGRAYPCPLHRCRLRRRSRQDSQAPFQQFPSHPSRHLITARFPRPSIHFQYHPHLRPSQEEDEGKERWGRFPIQICNRAVRRVGMEQGYGVWRERKEHEEYTLPGQSRIARGNLSALSHRVAVSRIHPILQGTWVFIVRRARTLSYSFAQEQCWKPPILGVSHGE